MELTINEIYNRVIIAIELLNKLLSDMDIMFLFDNREFMGTISIIYNYKEYRKLYLINNRVCYELTLCVDDKQVPIYINSKNCNESTIIRYLLLLGFSHDSDLFYDILIKKQKMNELIQKIQKENYTLKIENNMMIQEIECYPESDIIMNNIKEHFNKLKSEN